MAKRASAKAQRGLVIGVSDYPAPISKLPAVAADVREMGKVLSSKHGVFRSADVKVLTDKQATKKRVLEGLEATLGAAAADDTVFIYFAGHGGVEGNDYYFVAYDTDGADLAATGVPLSAVKQLFDQTRSRRVFLWLDFCHSGGILARSANTDDLTAIRRALSVVKGHGKVIVAACTSSQFAYENSSVGHGLFTDALLRGLRGEAKSAQGEVTAHSLYEFIDHQVGSTRQQPVFFGETTGRIVLMHYPDRSAASSKKKIEPKKKPPKATTKGTRKRSGTWIMLGDNFFVADSVRHSSDGKMVVAISPADGEEEAALAALRPDQYGGRMSLPFAANNDARIVRVNHADTHSAGSKQVWEISLTVEERGFTSVMTEASVQGIGPDEIARRRAGRILLNDPPPPDGNARRGYSEESFIEGFIAATSTQYPVKECVIRSVYQQHGHSTDWKEIARLKAVFLLKITGTVEHVIDLKIGGVRGGSVPVTFKGRRPARYSNVAPDTIECSGRCPLT
jgi:uncharacterized caspase-like protein